MPRPSKIDRFGDSRGIFARRFALLMLIRYRSGLSLAIGCGRRVRTALLWASRASGLFRACQRGHDMQTFAAGLLEKVTSPSLRDDP